MNKTSLISTLALLLVFNLCMAENPKLGGGGKPLNILFFVADDCEWDSAGIYGCPIRDITPNIDRLAAQGMRFMNAYSTVAVCQPVRMTMMTGLLAHHSGCEGFEPIHNGVTTLNECLHQAGYFIGMFGKNTHYEPHAKFCLDDEWQTERGNRNPAKVYEYVKEVVTRAKQAGKPFFCHMNCGDPHRPFFGSPEEKAAMKKNPVHYGTPSRIIQQNEVPVPPFLDDLPKVRTELAQYFNCVKRLDDSVGAALRALADCGADGDTLVVYYGGDHGMSFPFSKSNAYLQSNHGGLVIRWPDVVAANSVVAEPMVSTIDFTPTLLDAAKLPPIPHLDGRSFLPLLLGEKQDQRNDVFCYYYRTSGEGLFNMRAIHTRTDTYIWNPWSDGVAKYKAENMQGLSWKAMVAAGKTDEAMQTRCDYYLHREPEEYFVDATDVGQRKNRINDPACQARIRQLEDELQKHLTETGDPLAAWFPKRNDPAAMVQLRQELKTEQAKDIAAHGKLKKKGGQEAPSANSGTDPEEPGEN